MVFRAWSLTRPQAQRLRGRLGNDRKAISASLESQVAAGPGRSCHQFVFLVQNPGTHRREQEITTGSGSSSRLCPNDLVDKKNSTVFSFNKLFQLSWRQCVLRSSRVTETFEGTWICESPAWRRNFHPNFCLLK
ncbi:uncharacterized protein LOC144307378 isoform X3 [Canis aureus]